MYIFITLPSEVLSYFKPCGCIEAGNEQSFLKYIFTVSPTIALIGGPNKPKCAHFLRIKRSLKLILVYSRNKLFKYVEPIRSILDFNHISLSVFDASI